MERREGDNIGGQRRRAALAADDLRPLPLALPPPPPLSRAGEVIHTTLPRKGVHGIAVGHVSIFVKLGPRLRSLQQSIDIMEAEFT